VSDPRIAEKREAAIEAVSLVASGMVVGLGTGTTAALAIEEIGRRLASGALRDVVGVPTSSAAHHLGLAAGVPLGTLESHPRVDLTIDGADEVDAQGRVIKGHGGALLREKIVAARSSRWVLIVDPTKLVARLGTRFPVPVEVVRFGWRAHMDAVRDLGGEPTLRYDNDSTPYVTDEGHYLIDARFPSGIDDPDRVAVALRARPGVVDTGLFLGFAPHVIVGGARSRG